MTLLYKIGDDYMWFHIRNNEFIKLIKKFKGLKASFVFDKEEKEQALSKVYN